MEIVRQQRETREIYLYKLKNESSLYCHENWVRIWEHGMEAEIEWMTLMKFIYDIWRFSSYLNMLSSFREFWDDLRCEFVYKKYKCDACNHIVSFIWRDDKSRVVEVERVAENFHCTLRLFPRFHSIFFCTLTEFINDESKGLIISRLKAHNRSKAITVVIRTWHVSVV